MGDNTIRVIDLETGEYKDFSKEDRIQLTTQANRELIKQKVAQANARKLNRIQSSEIGGNFIFAIFKHSEEYMEFLSQSEITRLIFIATYLGYDGVLKTDNNIPIVKKNMNQFIKLSRMQFHEFYNKIIEHEIFIEEDGCITLNQNYFIKGEIGLLPMRKRDKDYTRLYIKAIRELYNGCNTREHKKLAVIFKLIPYLNYEYNIVCHNPREEELDYIEPMMLGEICDILGYTDCTHLKKYLMSIHAINGNKIVGFVQCERDIRTTKIYMNPYIIYRGNKWKTVEVLGKLCNAKKKVRKKHSNLH
jgi:hypothetical protein